MLESRVVGRRLQGVEEVRLWAPWALVSHLDLVEFAVP